MTGPSRSGAGLPEPPPQVIDRARLHARLDASRATPLTVLQAPAGYGKTVLLLTWLAARPELARRCRWLTLRPGRADADLGGLVGELTGLTAPLLVVVDDLDRARDPDLVRRLVDLALDLPQLHLVTASRATPAIPLGLLSSRGRLSEIGDVDLLFDAEDYRRLLELRGHRAAPAEVEDAVVRTGGWPGALRILSDHRHPPGGGHRLDLVLGSYLESEVLGRLAPADRALLRDASALTELEPLSAAAVTGRDDALGQLSRLHLSGVPMSWPEPQRVRVNPLLRETLLGQLRSTDPAGSRRLDRRVVSWLRTTGRPLEAIQQLLDEGDLAAATQLLGEEFLHHLYSDADTVRGLLEQVPEGLFWQTTLMRGFGYLASGNEGDPRAIGASLDAQLAAVGGALSEVEQTALAAFRLRLARHTNYVLEVDLTGAERGTLPAAEGGGEVRLARALSGSLHLEHGLWLFHHYELSRAREVLTEALTLVRFAGLDWMVAVVLAALSAVLACAGQHAEARRAVAEAELVCRDLGPSSGWLISMAHLARTLTELDAGDLPTARAALDQLRSSPVRRPDEAPFVAYLEASLLLLQGRPLDGLAVVQSIRQTQAPTTRFQGIVLASAAFHCLCQLERLPEAETELELVRRLARPRQQVTVQVLEARLLLRRGRAAETVTLLQPHLDRVPETDLLTALGLLTTYTAAAEKAGLQAEAEEGRHRTRALEEQIGVGGRGGRQSLLSTRLADHHPQLSGAELNVLRHLQDDVPLGLVAERLYVSGNTLKTHLRNIYRKLQVTGRDQAVERARAGGLL